MPQRPTESPPVPTLVAPRQCSRCRLKFDGDPNVPASQFVEWWLCAGCQRILLPRQPMTAEPVARALSSD